MGQTQTFSLSNPNIQPLTPRNSNGGGPTSASLRRASLERTSASSWALSAAALILLASLSLCSASSEADVKAASGGRPVSSRELEGVRCKEQRA